MFIDGISVETLTIAELDTSGFFVFSWNSANLAIGSHNIKVSVEDKANSTDQDYEYIIDISSGYTPDNYTISAKVIDNFGASDSTTVRITLKNPTIFDGTNASSVQQTVDGRYIVAGSYGSKSADFYR